VETELSLRATSKKIRGGYDVPTFKGDPERLFRVATAGYSCLRGLHRIPRHVGDSWQKALPSRALEPFGVRLRVAHFIRLPCDNVLREPIVSISSINATLSDFRGLNTVRYHVTKIHVA
jgi:hypothetical protein